MRTHKTVLLFLTMILAFSSEAGARPWRSAQIPNGVTPATGSGCINCHVSAFGAGPRNPFGTEVETRVAVGATTEFWSQSLAVLDSDGDGFSNGAELQDPEGVWHFGLPNPGEQLLVSNPGLSSSVPAVTETPTPQVTDTPTTPPTDTPTPLPTDTPPPTATPTATPVSADLNGDGVTDSRDLLLLMEQWKQH